LVYDGYHPETKTFDKSVKRNNKRIAGNEYLKKVASNMRRQINVWEQAGESWDYSRQELKDMLSKVNDKDRAALIREANSARARHHAWLYVELPQKLTEENSEGTTKVLLSHEPGMLPEQARDFPKVSTMPSQRCKTRHRRSQDRKC